jgi:superfamily II DNA/RNA helicase
MQFSRSVTKRLFSSVAEYGTSTFSSQGLKLAPQTSTVSQELSSAFKKNVLETSTAAATTTTLERNRPVTTTLKTNTGIRPLSTPRSPLYRTSRDIGSLDSVIADQSAIEVDEDEEGVEEAVELIGTPVSSFSEVLSEALRARLLAAGIKSLFPVQTETVRRVLKGENVVVRSRTGSGKTIGFALPVIEMLERDGIELATRRGRGPRCLVIAPTRELASQISDEFRKFVGRNLKVASIYGGVAMGPQFGMLREGVDIVVGTPGRMMDLLSQGALRLDQVKVAVLDEADEMLRMGFKEDVEQIFESTPEAKQCMLWSATMPPWVRDLAKKFLRNPQFVDLVGDNAAKLPSTVAHHAFIVDNPTREETFIALLTHYAREHAAGSQVRILVFTETKAEAGRLAMLNIPGVRMGSLTGDLSQQQRERTLMDYKAGRLAVICATDVAARGLDINDVEVVIQFRLPRNEEAFTHRAGRTGRAGKKGISIMLASPQEFSLLHRLETDLGFNFSVRPVPTADARNLAERDISKVFLQVLTTPTEAADGVVGSGLYDRITKRISVEQALRNALALLAAGGNSLAYKSLITGQRGLVTLAVRPCSAFFSLAGVTRFDAPPIMPGAGMIRGKRDAALIAYERACIGALGKLFDAFDVSPVDRPRSGSIFAAKDGLVFDMQSQAFSALRAGIDSKLSKVAEKGVAVESFVSVVLELPTEVKASLAYGPDQARTFEATFTKQKSLNRGGGASSLRFGGGKGRSFY